MIIHVFKLSENSKNIILISESKSGHKLKNMTENSARKELTDYALGSHLSISKIYCPSISDLRSFTNLENRKRQLFDSSRNDEDEELLQTVNLCIKMRKRFLKSVKKKMERQYSRSIDDQHTRRDNYTKI